jgi:hypoxanthine phosphoribosyltransferase
MIEPVIDPRLTRKLGSAFKELSEKIIAYDPDVVCPVLRAGKYVQIGFEHYVQTIYGLNFPSVDITSVTPELPLTFNTQERPYVNRFELNKNRRKISGKKVAVLDDIKFDGTTLKVVTNSLTDMKVAELESFCLYNNTILRRLFTVDEFNKYWHRRVIPIGDMIACRKDYRKGDKVFQDILYISIDDAERIIYGGNLVSLPELHAETIVDFLRRRVRSDMFQNEIASIISRHS